MQYAFNLKYALKTVKYAKYELYIIGLMRNSNCLLAPRLRHMNIRALVMKNENKKTIKKFLVPILVWF